MWYMEYILYLIYILYIISTPVQVHKCVVSWYTQEKFLHKSVCQVYRTHIEGGINMRHIEQFTKFPAEFIRCDINNLGISRKFYYTYILINRNRTVEDFSWVSIRKLFSFYGYKETRHKPKAFFDFIDVLNYMANKDMIEILCDLNEISYRDAIEIKINSEKFDCINNYAIITASQVDFIGNIEKSPDKDCLLTLFLYVIANINKRSADVKCPESMPEVFYQSLPTIATTLGMSKTTISQCFEYLCGENGLLVKKDMSDVRRPNIYAINKPGYEKEIQFAVAKLTEK